MAGRSIEDMSIAFIGAGNLATNLAKALYRKGFRIVQVYSRTKRIGAGIGTDGGSCIYHGAAGGYEGGAALYRFAEGRGFCRIITPDCFWKGECFYGCIQPAVFL